MNFCAHRTPFGCVTFAAAAFLCGCTPAVNQKFGMSFLPAIPKHVVTASLEAPKVEANPFLRESSTALKANLDVTPKSSRVDFRIRRAEQHFGEGKRLYGSGNTVAARLEFDAAIDELLATPEKEPDRAKIDKKLEEFVSAIHRYDVNGLGAGDLSGELSYDKAPLEDILEMTFPVDPRMKPKVKEQLTATQSQLPLQLTDPVLSYINFFSSDRGRRTLLAGLRRAGRYKPLISRILEEEKVPQELIYLAQAESGFLPRAVSHKAAVGMWQFVQARGRQYGLQQTAYHDDRLDPEKATRSAARHLRDMYNKFGDWYLAIAAYNCGDGCVERAIQRTGYADFWDLRSRNAIPKETTNYVPIIVALTIMHKNAKDYGLVDLEVDSPIAFETLEATASTHLALVADAVDWPVSELRELNPALLTNIAPAGYVLKVPKGSRDSAIAALATIPEDKRASWRIHRIGPGDTLPSIAKQYNMPVSSIAALNTSVSAEPGDVLIIPTKSQLERLPVVKAKRGGKGTVSAKRAARRGTMAKSKPGSRGSGTVAKSSGRRPTSPRAVLRRGPARGSETASVRR